MAWRAQREPRRGGYQGGKPAAEVGLPAPLPSWLIRGASPSRPGDEVSEIEDLKRKLADAIRRGDVDEKRAVKAELDRLAGPKFERADCPRRMDEETR